MPKISVYTAAGQFFNMCEQQLELAADRTIDTMVLDDCQHSDYQDNLASAPIELQTCPTVLFDNCEYEALPIRRTKSCPAAAMTESSIESEKLNEMTPAMIGFITNAQTDPPTTIGPKSLSSMFEKIRRVMIAVEKNASIFEKLDEYFVATDPAPASIFEKMSDLLDAEEARTPAWIRLIPHSEPTTTLTTSTSKTVTFSGYCADEEDTDTWATSDDLCHCFRCKKLNAKTWKSIDSPNAPQLPVFAKSPVDSLELYKGKVSTSTSSSSQQSTVLPTCSELALLREKVDVQRRLIDQLMQLNIVTEKIAKTTSTTSF